MVVGNGGGGVIVLHLGDSNSVFSGQNLHHYDNTASEEKDLFCPQCQRSRSVRAGSLD